MGNLLKKISRAVASLVIGCTSLGCVMDGGIPVKGNYPELTSEIQENLEEKFSNLIEKNSRIVADENAYKNLDEPAVSFEGAPKEIINYFFDFLEEDFRNQGFEFKGLDNLEVMIVDADDIAGLCSSETAMACQFGNKIAMPDTMTVDDFLKTFFHEYGHYLNRAQNEFTSIAAETYLPLEFFMFDSRMGSFLTDKVVKINYAEYDNVNPYFRMYLIGELFAPVNLKLRNGIIAKALDYVSHAYIGEIEAELDDALVNAGGNNMQKTFSIWNNILKPEFFKKIFSSIKAESFADSDNETESLRKYMEISLYALRMRLMDFSEESSVPKIDTEEWDEYKSLMQKYLVDEEFSNQVLRAKLVFDFNYHAKSILGNYYAQKGCKNVDCIISDELFELGRLVLDLNKGYPCAGDDVYECHPYFWMPTETQVLFAYDMIATGYNSDDESMQEEAESIAVNFFENLFPGVDFEKEYFDPLWYGWASTYVPPIGLKSALNVMKRTGDKDRAIKFLNAALYGQCFMDSNHPEWYDYCMHCRKKAKSLLESMKEQTLKFPEKG